MGKILQFKITLKNIKPPIWRRIQIPSSFTFDQFHVAIQDVMGWMDDHLYHFEISKGGKRRDFSFIGITSDDDSGDAETLDARKIKVLKYAKAHPKMLYTYDFGDNWEHVIKFEGEFFEAPNANYPLCLAGKQACPPEDIGGAYSYHHFLEAIADKKHPEHESYLEWVDGEFDSNHFDVKGVKFRKESNRF